MNYFIDIEATEYRQSIIAIGVVAENGETFYSLVKPKEKKVGKFITNLTGITDADVNAAPSLVSVCHHLYSWVLEQESPSKTANMIPTKWNPKWYCWGGEDLHFIRRAFLDVADDWTARVILGDISGGLIDFCSLFCNKYNIYYRGLEKVAAVFGHTTDNAHNPVEDAKLLYGIWNTTTKLTKDEIIDYLKDSAVVQIPENTNQGLKHWRDAKLPIGTICVLSRARKVQKTFTSYTEAAIWLKKYKATELKENTTIEKIAKHIEKAADAGQIYFVRWRIIKE